MSEDSVEHTVVTITPTHNGPYEVVGEVRVETPEGELIRETTKAWLCRCGHSQNKPFCDGHHRKLNWKDVEPETVLD